MSGPDRVTEAVLCMDCADRLRAAGYAAAEQTDSGTTVGRCELCQNRGYFSRYRCYKRVSGRKEAGE